jgi:hypothetical protein
MTRLDSADHEILPELGAPSGRAPPSSVGPGYGVLVACHEPSLRGGGRRRVEAFVDRGHLPKHLYTRWGHWLLP